MLPVPTASAIVDTVSTIYVSKSESGWQLRMILPRDLETSMENEFSAKEPFLGYLYQSQYALLLLLRSEDPQVRLSIESLDDVVFEKDDDSHELLQTKHHIRSKALLTNGSKDLWKSLRVWSTAISTNAVSLDDTAFVLVTTGTAPDGSAASKLCGENKAGRNADAALVALRQFAKSSTDQENQSAYSAFLSLSPEAQKALLDRVYILDASPPIIDVQELIRNRIRLCTRPEFLDSVCDQLQGWWLKRVIAHLSGDVSAGITYGELQAKINDIQEQYHQDNLPIHFSDVSVPEENELGEHERVFIEQLRLICVTQPRIHQAISDYYKAYQQRSKWIREELLYVDELEQYEHKLVDEWKRQYYSMMEYLGDSPDEKDACQKGRALFNWVDQSAEFPIRPRCTEPYVMRGSYHILANQLSVGWHPDFRNRLYKLLSSAVGVAR